MAKASSHPTPLHIQNIPLKTFTQIQLHRRTKEAFPLIDSAYGLKYVFNFPDSLHGAFHFLQVALGAIVSFTQLGSIEMGAAKLRHRSKWETFSTIMCSLT